MHDDIDVTPITAGQVIDEPGFYVMEAATYHADPVKTPSLSASIAQLLLEAPARAALHHPRISPNAVREESEAMDVGSTAHEILLQGINRVRLVTGVDDWRTNAAKDLRDKIRKDGNIPLLEKTWTHVRSMAAATRAQLDARVEGREMFRNGYAELVAVWTQQVNGDTVWCRARLDFLRPGAGIDDYKSTRASAHPADVANAMPRNGWVIQFTHYRRGVEQLTGMLLPMRFCVQEVAPPYLLSLNAPGPSLEWYGNEKYDEAVSLWQRSLASGRWEGYDLRTGYAALPAWLEQQYTAEKEEERDGR